MARVTETRKAKQSPADFLNMRVFKEDARDMGKLAGLRNESVAVLYRDLVRVMIRKELIKEGEELARHANRDTI